VVTAIRPARGGYLRPFGTAMFIRDYLMGRGRDYGVEAIDPHRGAPITDVHRSYKRALHSDMAEDMAARDAEEAARRGKPMTSEEIEKRRDYYLERIPAKLTRMRYSSFTRYFRFFMQLGWVERTGKIETSAFQEKYPPAPPRVFYRLTAAGRAASDAEWSNPIVVLYPDLFNLSYFREKNRGHRYYRQPKKVKP